METSDVLSPYMHRFCRNCRRVNPSSMDRMVNPRSRSNMNAIGYPKVPCNTRSTPNQTRFPNDGTSRNTHTTSNGCACTNGNVVCNLHQVINNNPITNRGIFDKTSINGSIGANFYVIAYYY